MARGRKIELDIGAKIDAGWSHVHEVTPQEGNEVVEPQQHRLVFQREKRRGKTVTLVGPFQLNKADASALLKTMKKTLGCGGSYKAPWMEFQGDVQESLRPLLTSQEFRFKR